MPSEPANVELHDFPFEGDALFFPDTIQAPTLEEAQGIYRAIRRRRPDKVIDLKCTVCGVKTGDVSLPANHPIDETTATYADVGFADVRCDVHT